MLGRRGHRPAGAGEVAADLHDPRARRRPPRPRWRPPCRASRRRRCRGGSGCRRRGAAGVRARAVARGRAGRPTSPRWPRGCGSARLRRQRWTTSYTSRLGRPALLATSAIASLRVEPEASRSATAARRVPGSVSSGRGSARALDDDGDLAAHAVGRPRDQLAQRSAAHLLVRLRQLAAHRGRAVLAQRLGHRRQRRLGAVRCLEEDHRALLRGQGGEPPPALARLARQEALEAEPVDRQPADGQRGQHGAGSGDGRDAYVVLDRGHDQPVARVGHARHPRVGHQHDPLAGQQRLEQRGRAGLLVALEVGHDPTGQRDPEVGAQPLEPPGVLGRDDVGAGELGGQPRWRVAGLPDRGAREDEDASHAGAPRPCSGGAKRRRRRSGGAHGFTVDARRRGSASRPHAPSVTRSPHPCRALGGHPHGAQPPHRPQGSPRWRPRRRPVRRVHQRRRALADGRPRRRCRRRAGPGRRRPRRRRTTPPAGWLRLPLVPRHEHAGDAATTALCCPAGTTGWAPSPGPAGRCCWCATTRSTTRSRRSARPSRTTRGGGGTTTIQVTRFGEVQDAYTSLSGTMMNC